MWIIHIFRERHREGKLNFRLIIKYHTGNVDMNWMEPRYVETANGRICYFLARGAADRPTLIFLHGLSANHTTWDAIASKLEEAGLNCLAPDLRGHGLSDKTKKRALYRLPVFAADLDEIIKKENLNKIILVGYSFGGYAALEYTRKQAQALAALALISTNHVSPLKYRRLGFLNSLAYGLVACLAWLLIWQRRKNYYYFNQASAKGYWQTTFRGLITMPLTINFWMLAETAMIDFSRSLGAIECPTLLLRGENDTFLSAAEAADMARKMPRAELVTLNASHYLASRHQTETAEAILAFLVKNNL